MTTLSLNIELEDEEAQAFAHLSKSAGAAQSELAAEAIRQMMRMVSTSFKVNMSVEDYRAMREKLKPYADQSGYESEEDFLRRTA